MKRTRHFRERMSQRGVSKDMVDLALSFGDIRGDKYVLNRNGALSLLDKVRYMEKIAKKVLDKGGVVVVAQDGNLITTYNCRGDQL
ncbi:MAG TPA: DUF4258 domain-containing protein [Terracidiphilus sp.]